MNLIELCRDSSIRLWNANSFNLIASFKGHLDWITCIAFSPDSKKIVTGSWDFNLIVWDVRKGKEKTKLMGHGSCVSSCDFSADGKQIISSSYDGNLKVWDAHAGTEITTLIGHDQVSHTFPIQTEMVTESKLYINCAQWRSLFCE